MNDVKNEAGGDLLDYGFYQTKVRKAIANERIHGIDLTELPIEITVENIDNVSNDEYIMLRRNSFGASDSSILLGVNPYKKISELIKEKVATKITEEERAVGELVAVRKGLDLEPLIIEKFEKYFKKETFKPKDMYRFKDYPYLTVNFDGVTGDQKQYIPVEIKVVTMYGEKNYNPFKAMFNETDGFKNIQEDISKHNISIQNKAYHYGIPPYYYTQLQQQMFGLNAPYGYLSVLFDKTWRFYSYLIWRDEAVIKDLIITGYKAWQQVEALREKQNV